MGMMNPALAKVGGESVSLTFVTGTLNRIGGNLAAAAGRKTLTEGQDQGDSYLARARIDASVWFGFPTGAGLSGIAGSHFRTWALLPPCAVMIASGLLSECATPSSEKRITSSIQPILWYGLIPSSNRFVVALLTIFPRAAIRSDIGRGTKWTAQPD
jgi:uncharacterized membrane protein YoaK (UPF0700 family)